MIKLVAISITGLVFSFPTQGKISEKRKKGGSKEIRVQRALGRGVRKQILQRVRMGHLLKCLSE